ncbi:dTDP-4-dehydrorhamnose 3,5-epimerase [Prochlorococcus marinus]|uniref:dTDP-4-dehydrorhamnose 3,5-epimerase n=1 Tax=Prochlorococcus marinus TaxID=1219 RepID=UPI0022B45F72|nr:dTDP-4-dehydrorhamnose 3,5-epimerase [Prochlorococcus marinus]
MNIIEMSIPEVLLIEPKVYSDDRGFFLETTRHSIHKEIGLPDFVQHNQSRSSIGVLRGLHYQLVQPQGKLVRCSRGKVFDVAVDIRVESENFGRYVSVILDDVDHNQLWIPPGFAHGFLVLSEIADICYMCTEYYYKEYEFGILWSDPEINIKWPKIDKVKRPILSQRDLKNKKLSDQSNDNLPSLN